MTMTDRINRGGLRLSLAALLAAACVTVLGTTAAQAGDGVARTGPAATWSVQPTARIPDPVGELADVSCTSQSFCVSVGSAYNGGLTAVWNGTNWQKQPLPGSAFPDAVSCASPTYCVAVGTDILTWNGTAWAVQASPAVGAHLNSVSCSSPSACLAVGEIYKGKYIPHPQVVRWNGEKWSRVANPVKNSSGELDAVSCSSRSACTATGYYKVSGTDTPLIERWNGGHLVVQQAAQPPNQDGSSIASVSCPGQNGCVAVGNAGFDSPPYIEIWNGTTWTAMTPPSLAASLTGLSCTTVTACTAVGTTEGQEGPAVAERLRGSTWTVQHVRVPADSSGSLLDGVSCPLATDCMAVGRYVSQSDNAKSLSEQWNRTGWAIQSTPNGHKPPEGSFTSVSCVTSSDCTAVGGFDSSYGGSTIPLSEMWNGTTWAVHNPPALDTAVPAGVSCPSAGTCVTVGTYTGTNDSSFPWAAVQSGTKWVTVLPPPPPGQVIVASLDGISCTSATFCIAVGLDYGQSSGGQGYQIPLAYTWNGTTWTLMTMPTSVTAGNLDGVSCLSATWCVAAGDDGSSWLAETWNGTTWTVTPTSGDPAIDAVSCSSAVACTAVGTSDTLRKVAIERWDGTNWTAQPPALSPPGYKIAQLNGVSCASATACTAAGYYWNGKADNTTLPFIQAWDGTGWTAEQAPATGYSDLESVSCTSPTVCTAAGATKTASVSVKPLAERSG